MTRTTKETMINACTHENTHPHTHTRTHGQTDANTHTHGNLYHHHTYKQILKNILSEKHYKTTQIQIHTRRKPRYRLENTKKHTRGCGGAVCVWWCVVVWCGALKNPMCKFIASPCVLAKRTHALSMWAICLHTRRRLKHRQI